MLEFVHRRLRDYFALPMLEELLRSERESDRANAVSGLVDIGTGAVRVLTDALESERREVRYEAVWGLSRLNSPEAVEGLLRALDDSSPDVQRLAKQSITRLGKRGAPAMLAVIASPGHRLRRTANIALKLVGLDDIVSELRSLLRSTDVSVRINAVQLLGDGGISAAIDEVVPLLQEPHPELREAAAYALGRAGAANCIPGLLQVLDDPEPGVRAAAATSLGLLGAHGSVARLERLIREDTDAQEVGNVRAAAVDALAMIGGERATAGLLIALRDPVKTVRYHAIDALGRSRDSSVVPDLAEVLENDDYPVAREAAARVMGELGHSAAVAPLLDQLRQSDSFLRLQIIRSLGRLRDARAVPALADIARRDERRDGFHARHALAEIGTPDALNVLAEVPKGRDAIEFVARFSKGLPLSGGADASGA